MAWAAVWYPSACAAKPLATEPNPCEWAAVAVAVVPSPMALEQPPVAVLFWLEAKLNGPEAVLFLPWAWEYEPEATVPEPWLRACEMLSVPVMDASGPTSPTANTSAYVLMPSTRRTLSVVVTPVPPPSTGKTPEGKKEDPKTVRNSIKSFVSMAWLPFESGL